MLLLSAEFLLQAAPPVHVLPRQETGISVPPGAGTSPCATDLVMGVIGDAQHGHHGVNTGGSDSTQLSTCSWGRGCGHTGAALLPGGLGHRWHFPLRKQAQRGARVCLECQGVPIGPQNPGFTPLRTSGHPGRRVQVSPCTGLGILVGSGHPTFAD